MINILRPIMFGLSLLGAVALAYAMTWFVKSDYFFFAAFSVLQFLVLGVAWNILGGYAGYVNFGVAGFFASGAYVSVALHKACDAPLLVLVVAGGVAAGTLGALAGALTLRLRGVYFAIATLGLTVLLETAAMNWEFVGGARGSYIIPPAAVTGFGSYIKFLFMFAVVLAALTIGVARATEQSRFGRALFALRDGEDVAEACGVPTLKVKIAAASLSCSLMGMSGALLPFYLTFLEPSTAFGMNYSISTVAIAMVGGISSWIGPVVGAILLGAVHQTTTVYISSEVGVLILGAVLMLCVGVAPDGIVGLLRRLSGRHAR